MAGAGCAKKRGGAMTDISLQKAAKAARRGRGRPFAKASPAILPAGPAGPPTGPLVLRRSQMIH